ncbi:MAG: hypothetical protein R3E97_16440 [Candidatus Eisenbacteria bacterium]
MNRTSRRHTGVCFRLAFLAGCILLAQLGCSDDPSKPDPVRRLPFGVHAVQRGGPGGDPLFAEAFDDMSRGGFAWSQLALDWGEAELGFGAFDLGVLGLQVQQSKRTGVPLSVVIRLIDGPRVPAFPSDLEGQGLSSPNVRVRFPSFVRLVVERGQGQISQLWIGRAVDQRLASHPEEIGAFSDLVTLAADSAHVVQSDLPIGTSFTYTGGGTPAGLDELEPGLDLLGWVVLPLDAGYEPALAPADAVELVREAVALRPDKPTVVTEVGYPRVGGDAQADEFLERFHRYLEGSPSQLLGVTWFGLFDWYATAADARASVVHPDDEEAAADYAAWLRASGLGQVTGVPTALWFRATDWNTAALP